MTTDISICKNNYIDLIMTQTNYTKEEAIEKLELNNNDYMKVIKEYMGICDVKKEIKSVNQEIFRQIRTSFDATMKTYREQHPIDINKVIEDFNLEEKME